MTKIQFNTQLSIKAALTSTEKNAIYNSKTKKNYFLSVHKEKKGLKEKHFFEQNATFFRLCQTLANSK